MHEAQMHQKNCFITLTYNDDALPANMSLDVEEWKKFAKRLRRAKGAFRFLHCGEYGEFLRPHYHACLFGLDFVEDRVFWKETNGKRLFISKELEEIWGNGFCTIGNVEYSSAAYVASYVVKKITGEAAEAAYERVSEETGEVWSVKPEYATMSRGSKKGENGGLGATWFAKYHADVYPDDFVVTDAGDKMRPPKYYDKMLEKMDKRMFEEMKQKRFRFASREPWNSTPERLHVRDELIKLRLKKEKR